ncbi:uncharacterized protein VTP21DRAFT_11579 [Calcarisporiella thermophila]|uniref:uncharacterized protein n=1 Tax=Calcarisporiella thermophila TaxID=911321 RepID=UPI0037428310
MSTIAQYISPASQTHLFQQQEKQYQDLQPELQRQQRPLNQQQQQQEKIFLSMGDMEQLGTSASNYRQLFATYPIPKQQNANPSPPYQQPTMQANRQPHRPTGSSAISQIPSRGSAVLKLLQYGERLSQSIGNKDIHYWRSLVNEFYSETGVMRLNLHNCENNESRQIDIPASILPRFYDALCEEGVISIQLVIGSIQEYMGQQIRYIECPRALLLHHYQHGVKIILEGHLRVTINSFYKIEAFDFRTQQHAEYISRNVLSKGDTTIGSHRIDGEFSNVNQRNPNIFLYKSPGSAMKFVERSIIPTSPVNAWGIPERVMRFFEISECFWMMKDLVSFSLNNNIGPKESLQKFALTISNMRSRTSISASSTGIPDTTTPIIPSPRPPTQSPSLSHSHPSPSSRKRSFVEDRNLELYNANTPPQVGGGRDGSDQIKYHSSESPQSIKKPRMMPRKSSKSDPTRRSSTSSNTGSSGVLASTYNGDVAKT